MKIDKFCIFSINYKECDLEEREHFIQNDYKRDIENYFEANMIKGYILLETCLRVEIYFEKTKAFCINDFDKIIPFRGKTKIYHGEKALLYLLNVICGLDSIIKGEDQILSQIKKAYLISLDNKKTSSMLNVIFNKVIEAGKKYRTISNINKQNLSLDSISVKFIKEKFENLENKKIFVIGMGDLSQSILNILYKSNVNEIAITNRSHHKSKEIKKQYRDVVLVDFNELYDKIQESDIIISATSAPHLIIQKDKMNSVVDTEKSRFFLDLAVPRDIDQKIVETSNNTLYHLEDIWSTYRENEKKRELIAEKYNYIIDEYKEKINDWFYYKNRVLV